ARAISVSPLYRPSRHYQIQYLRVVPALVGPPQRLNGRPEFHGDPDGRSLGVPQLPREEGAPRPEGEEPRDPGGDREARRVQGARRGDERRLVARVEGPRVDEGAGRPPLPPREEGVGDEGAPGAAAPEGAPEGPREVGPRGPPEAGEDGAGGVLDRPRVDAEERMGHRGAVRRGVHRRGHGE